MTNQEAVNRIYHYYFTNNGLPGFAEGLNGCSYRTEQGGRCGVGVLLYDETAKRIKNRGMNTSCIFDVLRSGPSCNELEGLHISFLEEIQRIHDSPSGQDYDFWRNNFNLELRLFCQHYNLYFPGDIEDCLKGL